MRELDDAAAYMLLATSNAQSELTALERGLHALRSGMDVRAYAESVGRKRATVADEICAAQVIEACPDIRTEATDRFSQLVAIHAAHQWLWPALVKAMVPKSDAAPNAGLALQGLRHLRPDQAVSFDEMVVLGKHGGDHSHGRDSKGRFQAAPKSQTDNISLGQFGTSAAYTAARLDRDGHADLAAKVRAREISANAAAIEAGFQRLRASTELFQARMATRYRRERR